MSKRYVCKRCGARMEKRTPSGQCEDCERLYPSPKLEVTLPQPKRVRCVMCGKEYEEMPERCECGENFWDGISWE